MTRVLFCAYHFPPVGGAGVQRNAKFAKYLPTLGVRPLVVTGPGTADDRWTPSDPSLGTEIGPGIEVIRVAGSEPPSRSPGGRGRAERWLGLPSPWADWWIDGVVAAGRAHADEFDLVYAAMAPYETAVAAERLSRELGKPWVADLQDPWALDEMWIYPTRFHRGNDTVRMRRLLATADAIVMNTPESVQRVVERLPELRFKHVVAIPNGFDGSDFDAPARPRDDETFRIAHTGYLHTALGRHHRRAALLRRVLGGANARVDILTRSHVYLLEALDLLLERRPELSDRIEVHLAGVTTPDDREAGQHDCVRFLGYLAHRDSLALIRTADLLFLPMHDVPAGERISIVPGKTYEYLAAGTPILAAVPDGDARDLLAASGQAVLCRPSDAVAMAELIGAAVARWEAGEPRTAASAAFLDGFERRALAADLAKLFARVGKLPLQPEVGARWAWRRADREREPA